MCNNPYMLLSHYEILACGTAFWKLLDLTVFAQSLLINSPLDDGVCPEQTAHVSDERETERERKVDWTRETGYHSSITIYRGSIPSLLVQRQAPHHTNFTARNTVPCCSLHLCSFLSHQLPAHCHLIYSGSVGFLVLTTHFPDMVHWPLLYHSTPSGFNGL